MIAFLSNNPLKLDSVGHSSFNIIAGSMGNNVALKPLLICDESFLHDGTEPISPSEIEAINAFLGKKVVKKIRLWRKPTRIEVAAVLEAWVEKQMESTELCPTT
jgi:hypothetical protein